MFVRNIIPFATLVAFQAGRFPGGPFPPRGPQPGFPAESHGPPAPWGGNQGASPNVPYYQPPSPTPRPQSWGNPPAGPPPVQAPMGAPPGPPQMRPPGNLPQPGPPQFCPTGPAPPAQYCPAQRGAPGPPYRGPTPDPSCRPSQMGPPGLPFPVAGGPGTRAPGPSCPPPNMPNAGHQGNMPRPHATWVQDGSQAVPPAEPEYNQTDRGWNRAQPDPGSHERQQGWGGGSAPESRGREGGWEGPAGYHGNQTDWPDNSDRDSRSTGWGNHGNNEYSRYPSSQDREAGSHGNQMERSWKRSYPGDTDTYNDGDRQGPMDSRKR